MASLCNALGSRWTKYIGFEVTVGPGVAFVWILSLSLKCHTSSGYSWKYRKQEVKSA